VDAGAEMDGDFGEPSRARRYRRDRAEANRPAGFTTPAGTSGSGHRVDRAHAERYAACSRSSGPFAARNIARRTVASKAEPII
jgi:hypothetical protein